MPSSGFLFWLTFLFLFGLSIYWLLTCVRNPGKRGTGPAIALCALLSFFSLAEISFRVRHYFWRSIPWFGVMAWRDDSVLGWSGTLVQPSPPSSKKVLFLGDSFTAGMGVPSTEMYYAVAAKSLGVTAIAYAAPGYGTLQEALALDRLYEQVQPDAVVLQVCSNDLINNYWPLERKSLHQRVLRPRPYLEGETIIQRMPRRGGWLRLYLAEHSRVFHFIFVHEEKLMLRLAKLGWVSSIEEVIGRDQNFPDYIEAQTVTSAILKRIKQRLGDTPFVAFLVDDTEPGTAALRNAFAAVGIDLSVKGIEALAAGGAKLRLADGVHLNANGNKILGDALALLLAEKLRREKQ